MLLMIICILCQMTLQSYTAAAYCTTDATQHSQRFTTIWMAGTGTLASSPDMVLTVQCIA